MNPSTLRADGSASFQALLEDGERVFCRVDSHANADGSVLTVQPAADHPAPLTLDRLAHEYGLKEELDGAWAVRPLELIREGARIMLVLEDPGGEPLERLLGVPFATDLFLRLAIDISVAVGSLHRRGLLHKDIKPANIMVNCADGQVRRTGFGAFYTTKPDGLGLGLSICRSIIEAHNGRLGASPNVPRGAIFGFIAPAHLAAAS